MNAIELQNVSKRYGHRIAIRDLTMTISSGEIFGFLGPNGAGKTTTIRLLLGLLRPDAGKVFLLGQDLANQKAGVEAKTGVGFLPDIGQMDSGFSGGEWLQYLARLQVSPPPQYQNHQKLLLERLQLSQADLGRKVGTYSRGMRQKLAIVQALQHCPRLLILDEPTEGLDPLAKHTLFELLAEACQDGATVFFSSHVLSEVERLCNRVALIRAGELVALDNVANLRNQLARRVELTIGPSSAATLSQLQQTLAQLTNQPISSEATAQGTRFLFELKGTPAPLLACLDASKLAVTDLIIEAANLEDVFLRFYQKQ